MPPKPFNPPRPSTSTSSTTKSNLGRPKGSASKSNGSSTSTSITKRKTPSAKSGAKGKENGKRTSGERARLSAASARSLLPSLSPDSDDEAEGMDVDLQSDDPFSQPLHPSTKRKSNPKPGPDLDEESEEAMGRKERIPDDLLNVIIHEMFKESGTRMSKNANKALGKYMDTFVREGLARAAWAGDEDGIEGGMGRGGGVLEVEDLERLAPQLLLDF